METPLSQLTLFAEAFHVNRTPLLADEAVLRTKGISGRSSVESFANLDPTGCWRKTSQGFSQMTLDGSLEAFCETWPRAGMTRSGIAFRLQPSAPTTNETGCGLLPTLRRTDVERGGRGDLIQAIRGNANRHFRMPTLRKADARGSTYQYDGGNKNRLRLSLLGVVNGGTKALGRLSPQWAAWFMGYPIDWLDNLTSSK